MERKRIDLAGGSGSSAKPAKAAKATDSDGASADKRKNLILAGVGAVAFVGAAYLIYTNFFATSGPPAGAATPEAEATFQEAAQQPPPAQDAQPMPEPGVGKRPG